MILNPSWIYIFKLTDIFKLNLKFCKKSDEHQMKINYVFFYIFFCLKYILWLYKQRNLISW